jgi:cytochrome d ubiquinol oxidase subunit II
MLNAIGPVWDGNEVWLITAGGATFAAFPYWYAALFSALYLPFVVVLVGLILRAVSIEFAGKGRTVAWRRCWDTVMALGSLVAALGIGAALGLTTTGLPLDANGDRVGGPMAWFSPAAVLGGLAVVGFCLAHASTFLALKTDGPVRLRMRRFSAVAAPVALLPILACVVVVQVRSGRPVGWVLVLVAAASGIAGMRSARHGQEGRAFLGYGLLLVAGVAAIFTDVFPVLLPSTLDHAWDLTVANASASPYALTVMSVVAAFGVPLVLAYQAWTYWVFRKRLVADAIPEAHDFAPAVRVR